MKYTFLLLGILTLVACKNISQRENNPEDIQQAKTKMDKFYKSIKDKDYNKAASLCDGPLLAQAPKLLYQIDSVWGGIKQYTAIWAKTTVTTINGKTTGEYNLKYKVEYEKSSNNEEDVFLTLTDDSLKITGYHSFQVLK